MNVLVIPQQYIFGEFSPDEFNQFFVTPRCFVEVSMENFTAIKSNQIVLSVYLGGKKIRSTPTRKGTIYFIFFDGKVSPQVLI